MKAKDLRTSAKGKKQPCAICKKHHLIAEQHHLISLKECANILNSNDIKSVGNTLVWLCPNCHSYFHALLRTNKKENHSEYCTMLAGMDLDDDNAIPNLVRLLNEREELFCEAIIQGTDGDSHE